MSELPHFEILQIVRCVVCRFEVAEVDESGWCRRCRRKFFEAMGE